MDKKELVRKGVLLGVGIAALAQEKAEKVAQELVKKGRINKAEGKQLVRSVYQEAAASGKRVAGVLEKELGRVLQAAGRSRKKRR